MDVKKFIEEHKVVIDSKLDEFLSPVDSELIQAMRYTLFAGGKRIRPILAWLSYKAAGGKKLEDILPFACGLELAHTFTLIHDDLPCMDNDDIRRGKPTNHRVFGEAMATLAGDALLASSFSLMLQSKAPPERLTEAIKIFCDAIGFRGVTFGQTLDLKGGSPTPKQVRKIHSKKTASFIRACIESGAILTGIEEPKRKLLRKAGLYMGMAFQIRDDLLDLIGKEEIVGKKTKKDEKKMTYPRIYGIEGAKFRAKGYARRANQIFNQLGEEWNLFKEITDFIIRRVY